MNYPEREGRFQNVHSSLYMTGHLDLLSGRFVPKTCGELDGGFDFYAPQTMRLPDGRRVLIAWKQMWGRTIPTAKDGWAGSFTLPRELHFIDGALFQTPVKEIKGYRCGEVSFHDIPLCNERRQLAGIEGTVLELEAVFSSEAPSARGSSSFRAKTMRLWYFMTRRRGASSLTAASRAPINGERKRVERARPAPSLGNGIVSFRIFWTFRARKCS